MAASEAVDGTVDGDGRGFLGRLCDYLIFPAFFAGIAAGTYGLTRSPLPPWAYPFAILAPAVAGVAVLERLRPERPEFRRLDQPFRNELGHFLLGLEAGAFLGNGAAVLAALGVAALLRWPPGTAVWPASWPLWIQVLLALALGDGVSYWQHRLSHRVGRLWAFHALHHSGARLNLVRAARFHLVDVGAATFLTYLPLTLAGASEGVLAWTAVLSGAHGLLLHANIRMRTPVWLDRVVCTPAVHRYHHSRKLEESDGNFGTTLMIFDHLFGSYVRPLPAGPAEMGIESDPVPPQFWRQLLLPFRGRP